MLIFSGIKCQIYNICVAKISVVYKEKYQSLIANLLYLLNI